ncbi:ABC transporter substrate-binding protein [Peribacillus cavernae]|uniref:ABC transporter substrate-binding protein n=1 Tax=Peribacillus cavernae TaxID=1674310 RepID=A0A433HI54_9BACI|nr:ABC transporter substrate-binding protein [Peribacillus cavernae]MDQ0220485.1 multiple sugar transport system substrate-binding protein [Peribacillus cavernae]RUQ28018.1 ABC transporter substrate-binding protein [Peribacillus cavernae]
MKKKKAKLLTGFMALSLILGACSSNETSSNSKEDGGKKDNKKVTIVYSRGKDVTKGTEKMVEAFEKAHPNIDVKFREMPADTGQSHDAYVTAFNAKSSEIDVIDMDVIWPAEFAQAGYVLPLDRFIQQDGIDLNAYNQGALSASQFNGKQWAMPKFIDGGLLFYRKDLVKEEEIPKTWDELLASAKEKKGEGGTKFGYILQAKQYEGLVCNTIEFVASYGGQFIDENGNVVVNSPETIKGLKKLVEIAKSDVVPGNVTTFTEIESDQAFIEGQTVFLRNWPYEYASANDKEKSKIAGKVGIAPLPAGDKGSAAALGGWQAGISKYSKHPKEAWEFLKFMTGQEGQKIDAIYGGHAPTITKLYEDQEVLEANPTFADKGFVEGLNSAVSRPVAPNYPEISEIIQIQVSKAIAGEQTVEQAVKNMETEMKAKLVK